MLHRMRLLPLPGAAALVSFATLASSQRLGARLPPLFPPSVELALPHGNTRILSRLSALGYSSRIDVHGYTQKEQFSAAHRSSMLRYGMRPPLSPPNTRGTDLSSRLTATAQISRKRSENSPLHSCVNVPVPADSAAIIQPHLRLSGTTLWTDVERSSSNPPQARWLISATGLLVSLPLDADDRGLLSLEFRSALNAVSRKVIPDIYGPGSSPGDAPFRSGHFCHLTAHFCNRVRLDHAMRHCMEIARRSPYRGIPQDRACLLTGGLQPIPTTTRWTKQPSDIFIVGV